MSKRAVSETSTYRSNLLLGANLEPSKFVFIDTPVREPASRCGGANAVIVPGPPRLAVFEGRVPQADQSRRWRESLQSDALHLAVCFCTALKKLRSDRKSNAPMLLGVDLLELHMVCKEHSQFALPEEED